MGHKRTFHWFGVLLTTFVFVFACSSLDTYVADAISPAQHSFYCGFTLLGRNGCQGYLTNTDFYVYNTSDPEVTANNVILYNAADRAANALPANINSSASFETEYETYLSRGSPTKYDYDSFGAAASIDVMLGVSGPDLCLWYTSNASSTCTWQAAVAYAQNPAHLADWVSRVDYYASNGWINWNFTMFLPIGFVDSGHACTVDTPQCTGGITPPISPSVDAQDIVWKGVGSTDDGLMTGVSFDNPDGSHFILDRYCGNFVGQTDGLAAPPPATPPPTCDVMTTSLPYIDPQENFTITASVTFSSSADASTAASAGYKIAVAVTGPNGYTYNSGKLSPSVAGNDLTATTSSIGPVGTGAYTVSYNTYDASGNALISPGCNGAYTVTNMPYFTVQNGDVSAGAGMATEAPDGGVTCTAADPKAGIVSWNQEAAGNYGGAGTQYAAYALNYLQDFATAQGSSNPSAPSGLAFANTTNISGNDLFGGGLGAEPCAPDYFANATNIQTGNVTIGGQSIANGTHTTVYVKGNVYITGNITYSGSYANTADIPSYAIVVEGNIYIAPGVSNLEGLYVAEPASDGTGGVIYTCATGFSAPSLDSSLYGTCNDQSLSVTGSFVANQVQLLRTTGTVGQSSSAAETFDFNPEIWLTTPPITSSTGANNDGYDAITSLPPVL